MGEILLVMLILLAIKVVVTGMFVDFVKFPYYSIFGEFKVKKGDEGDDGNRMLKRKKKVFNHSLALVIGSSISPIIPLCIEFVIRLLHPDIAPAQIPFGFWACIICGTFDAAFAGPLSDYFESKKNGMVFVDRRKVK